MNWILELSLLVLAFLFSGTEAAWRAMDPVRLRNKADNGNRRARQMLSWVKAQPQADLVLAWSARSCAAASIVLFCVMVSPHIPASLWFLPSVIFIFLYAAIDIVVRRLMHRLPIAFIGRLWWLVAPTGSLWAPLARPVAHYLRPTKSDRLSNNLPAPDELLSLAKTAESISPQEFQMLESVLKFRQLYASNLALPLDKFACTPANATLGEILANRKLADSTHTLVIGADHAPLGVMNCGTAALSGAMSARAQSFARPLISFPSDLPAWTVLVKLRRARNPVALVLDSKTQAFLGIVTDHTAVACLLGQ